MEAIPIAYYLDRKSRESGGVSGDPNRLDIKAASDVWFQEGFREGMQQAKTSCDAAVASREEECKLWIEAARKDWSETEGASLAREIERAAAGIKADIADAAARILRPFVAAKLADEALAKLAIEIEKLLSQEDAIHLKISGPADLVSELRKRIPPHVAVTVLVAEKPEVMVFANKTVIETRLGEWFARIGVNSHVQE
ncbi:MAG: hypothetical protein ACLPWS_08745 [Rhodomicrobium sp.]